MSFKDLISHFLSNYIVDCNADSKQLFYHFLESLKCSSMFKKILRIRPKDLQSVNSNNLLNENLHGQGSSTLKEQSSPCPVNIEER